MPRLILRVMLATALTLPTSLLAERFERFGDYELHYNAVATGDLDPDIARHHGIDRSRTRALLTMALLRDEAPVGARIEASATNLAGQRRQVGMREVREGQAIYYIGTFAASDGERIELEIEARPLDSSAGPFRTRFVHRFHSD